MQRERLESQWAQSAAALLLELPKGQRLYTAAMFDRSARAYLPSMHPLGQGLPKVRPRLAKVRPRLGQSLLTCCDCSGARHGSAVMLCHFCCSCGTIVDARLTSALPTTFHCSLQHVPVLTVVLHKLASNAQYTMLCLILDQNPSAACKLAAFQTGLVA